MTMDWEYTFQVILFYAHSGFTTFLFRAQLKISDLVQLLEEEEAEKQMGQLKLADRRGY